MSYENQGAFTSDNARKVIRIMMRADGGCGHCVGELLDMFLKEFPGHLEDVNVEYEKENGYKFRP